MQGGAWLCSRHTHAPQRHRASAKAAAAAAAADGIARDLLEELCHQLLVPIDQRTYGARGAWATESDGSAVLE
jgi:hypothetical protein